MDILTRTHLAVGTSLDAVLVSTALEELVRAAYKAATKVTIEQRSPNRNGVNVVWVLKPMDPDTKYQIEEALKLIFHQEFQLNVSDRGEESALLRKAEIEATAQALVTRFNAIVARRR